MGDRVYYEKRTVAVDVKTLDTRQAYAMEKKTSTVYPIHAGSVAQ